MLAGKFRHLIRDVFFAQHVGKLVVADDRVIVRAAGHKNKSGVLRLGFFRQQKDVIFFARFAVRRTKDVSEAEALEGFVKFRIARSRDRAAQAAGKKEQPWIFQRQIDGRIAAAGDSGDGARVTAIDAKALAHITKHVLQK